MSEYTLAVSVGAPGQSSAVVIVSRGREYGPKDPRTWEPLITRTLIVDYCERLEAGLKDSEIATHLDCLLGKHPLTGHTRVFIEHPGGKAAINRMREKIRPGLATWSQGVKVMSESDVIPTTVDALRRVSHRDLVNYMVPICADAELRNPYKQLSQQLIEVDPNAAWRDGDSDLASALFLASWFSRGASLDETHQALLRSGVFGV